MIEGCTKTRHQRGWCSMHYSRWYRNGDPTRGPVSLEERFWKKVQRSDSNDCWLWTGGAFLTGYGALWIERLKQNVGTHRLSWELHFGPIADGLCVCHTCDVRRCVNPSHLFLGTKADNLKDMAQKGRAASGEHHGGARLTWPKVDAIRQRRELGETIPHLAQAFGVSTSTVFKIIKRQKWREIA